MPVDWRRYPANWKEIVERIRARSGDKCEWCGVPNRALGLRMPDGSFIPQAAARGYDADFFPGGRPIRIVLTTAHLGKPHADGRPGDKHDKMDVRDENLAHLCQRCHLLYDLPEHMENARRTRNTQRGRIDLFEAAPPPGEASEPEPSPVSPTLPHLSPTLETPHAK